MKWVNNWNVSHGDKVTFIDNRGEVRTGKVNGLLMFPDHLVLDMGGRYGTPAVVYPSMVIKVTKAKEPA